MPVLKNVEHNSQNEFYRSPVGAAESYTDVRLRIKLELDDIEDQKAEISVKARFWRERVGELVYVLEPEDPVGREMYFSANIAMPEKGCLMWYYFVININGRTWYYGNNDACGMILLLSPTKLQCLTRGQIRLAGSATLLCTRFFQIDSTAREISWWRKRALYTMLAGMTSLSTTRMWIPRRLFPMISMGAIWLVFRRSCLI